MSNESKPELVRGLGAWAATAMVVGNIIGTGVFLVASPMARATDSLGLVFLVWIVGGMLSIFGALAIAELGAAIPEAGGAYVYLKRGFGGQWGFLFGWMNNLVGKPASISTIAAGFLIFVTYFVPQASAKIFSTHIPLPFAEKPFEFVFTWAQPLAALAIIGVTIINYLGVRLAGQFQVLLTSLKVGSVVAVALLGFLMARRSAADGVAVFPATFNETVLTGFLTAMVAALWAYDGWFDLTLAGSEIEKPHRNIPLAVVGGTLLVAAVYLMANAMYFYALPFEAVKMTKNVAAEAVRQFAGENAAAWITAAMVISGLGTLNSSILTGARVPYAMARDKLFFRVADGVHPQYRTPAGALVFQCSMACIMVMTGQFEDLFSLFIFAQWIFYGLAVASVIALRRREPDLPRPYRCWGYPVVPALFVMGALALTVNIYVQRPVRSTIGLGLILSGLFFYRHWRQRAAH